MFFWKKESEEDKLLKQRQEETVKALESGGIPPIARHRLEAQKKLGSSFFTSDLTAKEYLVTKEAGYQTLGQVMGSSFVNVGFFRNAWTNIRRTGELEGITSAKLMARKLAVQRLEEEAALLGADGVIGVRLIKRNYGWVAGLIEFTAIGTAINVPEKPDGARPFTSHLKGQEFWQLHKAGYWPKGLAFGISSYYVYTDPQTQSILRTWWGGNATANQEVQTYTQGFYQARERAMRSLTKDIVDHGGHGVVGVEIDQEIQDIEYEVNDRTYHDMLIHFAITGTVIEPDEHGTHLQAKAPLMVYNLASGKYDTLKINQSGEDYIDQDDSE